MPSDETKRRAARDVGFPLGSTILPTGTLTEAELRQVAGDYLFFPTPPAPALPANFARARIIVRLGYRIGITVQPRTFALTGVMS